MSFHRSLTAGFAAAVMVTALGSAGYSQASSSSASAGASGTTEGADARLARPRAKLQMHPQIADAGKKVRNASKAKSAMTATIKPKDKGKKVILQRKAGGGWKKVATQRQSRKGTAEFTAPYKRKGKVQTYRVKSGKATSKGVKTSQPGSPDLNDQFADPGPLLPSTWEHRQTAYDGLRKCAKTHETNLLVGGGALRLSVTDDPTRPTGPLDPAPKCRTEYGTFDWRWTAQASTEGNRAFKYGYAAARIKFQPRAGQHGSFWMQPANPPKDVGSAEDTGAEIDIIEWFGDRKKDNTELTSFAYYYPKSAQDPNTDGRDAKKVCGLIKKHRRYGKDWAQKYHVFSLEWTPKRYVFRIDGKETCRSKDGVSGVNQFLILSLQANTYELPLLDGNPDAPHSIDRLPQHMYVDWVRYWKR